MPKKEVPGQWYILDICPFRRIKDPTRCCRCHENFQDKKSEAVDVEWTRLYVRPDIGGAHQICLPCLDICKKSPVDYRPAKEISADSTTDTSLGQGRSETESKVLYFRPGR